MGFSYNVNVLNQKGSPALYTDIFANRPAAGYQGRLFISTDTAAIYEDTGTAWTLIANVSSGAGTLQQVTTNGNTSNVGISVTAGGVSTNSLTDTSLTTGSVPFAGAGGLISQDNANLFWDDTNNRLGINTNTPGNSLDVHSAGTNPILALNNTAGNQSAVSFLNTSVAKWRIGNTATNTLDIYNFVLSAIALQIKANNNAVFISSVQADEYTVQPTGYSILASLSRNLTGAGYGVLSLRNSANGTIQPSSLTVDRTYTLPDATGTIALTADLSAYLPLAGGTLTGTLNGTSANFSSNSCIGTLTPVSRLTIQAPVSANPNTGGLSFNLSGGTTFFTIGVDNTSGDGALLAGSGGAIRFHTNSDMATTGEAMRLSSGRNLLIGNTVDDTVNKLQVTGSIKSTTTITATSGFNCLNSEGFRSYVGSSATGDNIYFTANYTGGIDAIYQSSGNTNDFGIWLNGGSTSAYKFLFKNSGVLLIANLAGTGSRAVLADASGNLSAPVSDISVKQNIEPLKYGLETIMKLNAVQFEFIEEYKNYGEGLQIGAIAQEVEEIIPEAVFKTPLTGLKGIDYNQLNGIYIKAIQDQQKIIESLIQRIELLENK